MYSGPARRFLTTHTQLIRCYSSTPPRAFVINSQNLSKAQSPRDSRRHVFARFTSDEASKRDGQNTSELTDASHIGEGSKLGEGYRGEDGSQLAKGSKEDDSIESMLANITPRDDVESYADALDEQTSTTTPELTGDSALYGRPVKDLPVLPGRPEYPVNQLQDKQLHKYVVPLYSRQWRINYTFKKAIVDSRQWYKSATLCRTFEFPNFERMMDFVTEVAKISQTESHFPVVTFEEKIVHFHTFTASAFRNPEYAPGDSIERQRPGLTLRDVRLAITVEDMFARHFLSSGNALPGRPANGEEPINNAQINKAVTKAAAIQGKLATKPRAPVALRGCRVCGGKHDPIACPERYTKPPPAGKACRFCDEEGHWSMNCKVAELKRLARQKRTKVPMSDVGSPPSPCPNCGGGHWKAECTLTAKRKHSPPILNLYEPQT